MSAEPSVAERAMLLTLRARRVAVDVVGTLLSILGMGRDHANRVSDRRAEVARLNAEIAAEFGRSLDVLREGRLGLLRRCAMELPDNPEIAAECRKMLDSQEELILQVMKITEDNSQKIAAGGWGSNWELALQKAHEMRGTATRSVPFIEGILRQCESVLDGAGRIPRQ